MSRKPLKLAFEDLRTKAGAPHGDVTFNADHPFGMMKDALDRPVLNLGAAGILYLMMSVGEVLEQDLENLLPLDMSRSDLRDWLSLMHHIGKGTAPDVSRPDLRALLRLEYEQRSDLYQLFGFPPLAL